MSNKPFAVSDTGPLISMFQSNSLDLALTLFGQIHISETCQAELIKHGWQDVLEQASTTLIIDKLTAREIAKAKQFAHRIAVHPMSKDRIPDNHLGEAEAMVLVQRSEFATGVLLLDELIARAVAKELGLRISGFAGVLLLAVYDGLLTASDLKKRLESCRQQGTHYSRALIEQVYRRALSY